MASIVPITNGQDGSNTQSVNLVEATPDMKQAGAIAQRQIDKRYDEWKQQQVSAARAHNADMASVGYDKDKYAALIASGAGLSQMSDHEREYITKRYQASNPFDRKAYTDSVVDQYLSSVGMPSSQELNTYRKAYYEYAKDGCVRDNYPELDDDAYDYIRTHWKEGMQTGIDGKLYNAKGAEVSYADTLLDDQLKAIGLPPSSMLNDYYLDYKTSKQIDADIDGFFSAVYEKAQGGMPTDEAYRTTLADPQYRHLTGYGYVSEAITYPNESDYVDNDPLSETYGQTDRVKYDAAWKKAVDDDAKRDAMDHRISLADYEAYAKRRSTVEHAEAEEQRKQQIRTNFERWVTTPATTEAEKEQRKKDTVAFRRAFMGGEEIAGLDGYFSMLDYGVPYDVLNSGDAAINEWNETKNRNGDSYADVKLAMQGYSSDFGDYEANRNVILQTRDVSGRGDFGGKSAFDVTLYNDQTYVRDGRSLVSPAGAIYAEVNGKEHASVDFTESDGLFSLYSVTRVPGENGKRLTDYMSEEERGVFNYCFRESPDSAMQYLEGLYDMLEDRQYVSQYGSFAERFRSGDVSTKEISDFFYDVFTHEHEEELENNPDGDYKEWQLNAWRKYASFSDNELESLLQEKEAVMHDGTRSVAELNDAYDEYNQINYVSGARKEIRAKSGVETSLYGYTPEAGAAATAEHDYSEDIVPEAPKTKEKSFWEIFAQSVDDGPDWSSTIEYVQDGGHAYDTEKPIFGQMSDAQKDVYNWLYKYKGAEAAQAYYRVLRPYLDKDAAEKVRAENKERGKADKIGMSIASVPGTFVFGMMSVVGSALNFATGTELTKTQAASWNASNAWREGVSEDWHQFGQIAYGLSMSMADSTLAAVLGGVGGPVAESFATAALASSAYADALDAALVRGLDTKHAYQTALVAGVAEYVTEKISLDNLLEGIAKHGKDGFNKRVFKEVAKHAFVEGTEEVNSDIINFVWDRISNVDLSEFNQSVKSYVDAGYTEEEAKHAAWRDVLVSMALSFGGGAISGGIMAGAGGAGKLVMGSLYNYAYGEVRGKSNATETREAPTVASTHATAFAAGRSAVERVFGTKVADNTQSILDGGETEETAKRIDALSEALANVDNTSDLYGYTHDAEGNMILSDDERAALASVLALAFDDASPDTLDAAFIHAMAQMQTNSQREANTNYDAIKTAQEVRNVNDQIAKTRNAIETVRMELQNKLTAAQNALDAANQKVAMLTERSAAETDIGKKLTLQESLKAAIDERDHIAARAKAVQTTDAADAEARIKSEQEEIARQQTLLDRHYASASAFLNEFAPMAFSGAENARAAMSARAEAIGAEIDKVISSEMSEEDRQAALAPLRERLAAARSGISDLDSRIDNADPNALKNAMNAIKSGSVSDFVREQQKAAQDAKANRSTEQENTENKASDDVKQGAAKSRREKTQHVIGKRVQQNFDRIAKRFGCEIVWGDDSTQIGQTGQTLRGRNGAYNAKEPNKIYLNTTMLADKSLSSTQVVAREFFTHEIVHYVANTKTYQRIKARAAAYYDSVYGKGGADSFVNGIMDEEHKNGNANYSTAQAQEEMTAIFAQEVLFAGENGNRRALVWLARSDRSIVGNFLNTVEYLIRRGNVRRSKGNSAMKTLLLDSEIELITALRERQYLDNAGLSSAFGDPTRGNAQQGGTDNSVRYSNGNVGSNYLNQNNLVRIDDDTELARLIQNRGDAPITKVIADYIMSTFGGETLTMSDGREVIIDRHDAKKLGQYPKPRKTAEIANVRKIIEAATYDHSVIESDHKKFSDFHYYVASVEYEGTVYGVELSVGTARNDKQFHLYDIRDWKKNGTAGSSETNSPMPGPKAGVSNTSDSSINSIGNLGDSVNTQNAETVADLNRIFKGNDVRHSRGATSADYLQNARQIIDADLFDVDSVYSAATPLQEELNGIVRGLCEMLGTEYEDATQKSKESMRNKVERKHKEGRGDYTLLSMKDHARQKVFVNDWTDIPAVLDYLSSRGIAYETEAVGPTEYGYQGFHITWTNENGLGSELQVTKPDVWKVKLASDAIYDKWRNVEILLASEDVRKEHFKDKESSIKMWESLHLPDFKSFESSSSERMRPFISSSPNMDLVGRTHLPSINSMNEGEDVSITRPDSVLTMRDFIDQSPFVDYNGIILQDSNSVKQADGNGSDVRFSRGMTADDYIRLYGQKSQNPFAQQNDIRTPEFVDDDNGRVYRVSDSVQTLKEVPHIRQNVRELIDNGVIGQADGIFEWNGPVYKPVTLDQMREYGPNYITKHGGLTNAMRLLTEDMPNAKLSSFAELMSAANQVFTEIGAEGTFDPKEYYQFVASYIEMRSIWGRAGRTMQLVNDSPLGRVTYWNRVVQRINEKNRETIGKGVNRLFYRKGYTDITVPQSFFDTLAQARTQAEIDAAEYAITQYIGQNSPLTVSSALRNWRYFSMLANPVTHARNMLGNVTMLGGRAVKDVIATGMENVAVRAGWMSESDRTHAIVLNESEDVRAYVQQLWADNANAVQSGGRDGFKSQFEDATRKSPSRAIDAAMRFNSNALETEDRLFLYMTFKSAASQYIRANGLDVNNITQQQRAAVVQYATQQAQEATYRDASAIADALNRFAKTGWAAQLFVDAVMPFKKTPINIAKRGIEYSPVGIAKGLVDIARNASAARRGDALTVSASKVVDELAKGLTGTAVMALGFFLSKCGILKLSAGDGDRDSTFEKDVGHQDYSLEIGDLSIKIESLAPMTFPLFMGAALQRLTSAEYDGLSMSDVTEAIASLSDPLMDMSFMASLNEVLQTYEKNKLGGVFENVLSSYVGQYFPTIGSKFNQTVNATRRTTKASQASPIGTTWDYRLRSWASKLPGVNQAVLEPYVKTTGEYDVKGSFTDYALAFMNNFVSPVNVQIMDTEPVNEELARLVTATGQTDFVPQNPKKYLTINSERYNMTAKEYSMYSKEHNETVYAALAAVMQLPGYANMTDDQRVQALEKAYDRAHKAIMDKYKIIFAQK